MRRLPGLSALKVFEVVGQTRSFTRAAERLNLTQSAVSKQIRNLEDDIREPLVIRRHRHLELTPAGAALLETIQQAFHDIEMSLRGIAEKQNLNRLRINVPPTFAKRWLVPRLAGLKRSLPALDISIGTALADSLAERGLLDCAIRFGDGEWPTLDARRLMSERHIVVASPLLLEGKVLETPGDLAQFTFLHVLASPDQRYLTWRHWLDAAGFPELDTDSGLEFDVLDLAIEAARCGLGVTIADRSMVRGDLAAGTLTQLFDVQVEGHESYWFVTRPQASLAPNIRAFRDWLFSEIDAENH
ncbi:LysR substrate-binding domain-containing protein [Rhizobium sp. YJ-22]|uniref:LysR substrate-binding domain-containing protein n=1 Tax=Rhizobium sp. YJ-22 TaxID=3037556 RepID=UPI002412D823|nr:LysR substrate-binding domain-containing protein [Rhizobium sp. YJ-22]MDG3579057.1 LysR substrate-binding domain-containing protein [Rhizobium sp. YJ-22]